MNLILSLIKNPKLLKLLLIPVLFWMGWEWRDRSADLEIEQLNSSIKEMALRVSEERLELESKLRNTLAKVDTKNAELDALRKDQELTVAKALIEYVEKEDTNTDCTALDLEWMQLYNLSNKTNMPSK